MTDIEVKSSSSTESICCLCLCAYGSDIVILECGHTLHYKCLAELLIKSFEYNKEYKCPLCRCILKNYSGLDGNKLKAECTNEVNEHTTFIVPIEQSQRQTHKKEYITYVCKIFSAVAAIFIIGCIIYYIAK
jgi:hypothetical protein